MIMRRLVREKSRKAREEDGRPAGWSGSWEELRRAMKTLARMYQVAQRHPHALPGYQAFFSCLFPLLI